MSHFSARHSGAAAGGTRNPAPSLFLCLSAKLRLALRASRLLFGIAQKVTKKARHRTRWSDSPPANRTALCFSGTAGSSESTSVCSQPTRAHPATAPALLYLRHPCRRVRAPLRAISAVHCDARHREWRRSCTNPCIPALPRCSRLRRRKLLASRCCCFCGRMPPNGAPVARRGGEGKVRRMARRMRASSLNAHGRASSEPRSRLADPQGRRPGGRAIWGVFLW